MRLIDADALLITVIKLVNNSIGAECDGLNQCLDAINNAPTVERKPFASVTFNKDELEQIIKDRVIEPIKNGELVVKEERPHGEWILISERLPDRFEDVLITYQIPNREPKVRRALYVGGKFNFDNGDVWNWNDLEIKAWMPLPKAYKEETENE